jgi:hypothetical protein
MSNHLLLATTNALVAPPHVSNNWPHTCGYLVGTTYMLGRSTNGDVYVLQLYFHYSRSSYGSWLASCCYYVVKFWCTTTIVITQQHWQHKHIIVWTSLFSRARMRNTQTVHCDISDGLFGCLHSCLILDIGIVHNRIPWIPSVWLA